MVGDWDTGKHLDPLLKFCYANLTIDGTLVFIAPEVFHIDVEKLRCTRGLA